MTFTALTLGMWGTLFGGVAGVITLLYMLRLRRRKVEVPFSPLWQQVVSDKQATRLFSWVKRVFSLLLQLLLVALLVTAIADPKLDGDWTTVREGAAASRSKPEPAHVLLVVDTSASMAATDVGADGTTARIELARRKAKEVLGTLKKGDLVMLARMDRDLTVLTDWTDSRESVGQLIDRLEAIDASTNPETMMSFARNAVRGLSDARVLLVTDRAFAPLDSALAKSIHLALVPLEVDPKRAHDNLAVLDFVVRSHLGNALSYAMYARVKNLAERPVTARAYVTACDRCRSRDDFVQAAPAVPPFELTLAAGEEKLLEREGLTFTGSRAALRIEAVEGADFRDVLASDDVAFATVPKRKQVKIQLVGKPNLFLQAVLEARSQVDVTRTETFQSAKGFDLTVFDGLAPKLEEPGNFIYVNASGEGRPYAGQGDVEGGALKVPDAVKNHPLMRFVRFVEVEPQRVQRMAAKKGDLVLARTRAGQPAMLARSDAERRFVAVGFDAIASEWVGHFSYSIFFVNTINWFFREESQLERAQSLARRWDVAVRWKGLDQVQVVRPDGGTEDSLVDGSGRLVYTGRMAGMTELRHPSPATDGDKEPQVVAAALQSPEESDLAPRDAPDVAVWQRPPPELAAALPAFDLGGAKPWQWLVLLALGLVCVEWLTFHRRWTV